MLFRSRANARYHKRDLGGYADYRRAFAIGPERAAREVVRILAEDIRRDQAAVFTNCARHLKINPTDITAFARRGLTLLLLRRDEEARQDFQQILLLKPDIKDHLDLVINAAKERRAAPPKEPARVLSGEEGRSYYL